MIICISGYTGSGKTTVGEKLAKALNIKHVSRTYKEFVKEHVDLIKFQHKLAPSVDMALDKEVVEEARKAKNCVLSTWLGPWMIKEKHLNVWLNADMNIRARRTMKHVHLPLKGTIAYIKKKESQNKKRWKKLYNIDLDDHSIFDIEINSGNFTPDQIVGIIAAASIEKEKMIFK